MVKKLFKQMLLAQIISAMAVMVCMLIDSIMIGRFLGVTAMAAYGLATPVLLFFSAVGSMMSAGVQVMCARTMGSKETDGPSRCYSIAMISAVAVSIVGILLVFIFINPLTSLLGAVKSDPVFKMTADYLRGFIVGAPAFICAQIFVPFLQMSGERKRVIIAVGCMAACNVLFNSLNVFVIKGGTLGMGLASSASYYVAVGVGLSYFLGKKCIYRLKLKGLGKADLKELLSGGIPTIINQIAFTILVLIINNTLLSIGNNEAVAAYSVISSTANICYCIGSGIASVSLMLAGMFYTEEDRISINALVKVQMLYAVILDALMTLVVLIFAKEVALLFLEGANMQAIKYTAKGVRLFSLCLIPSALNTSLKNYYQATNRVKLTEVISVLQNLVFPGIAVVVLGNLFGVNAVWFNFLIGESAAFIFITVYTCLKTGKKLPNVESYAYLPVDFARNEPDSLEFRITNGKEAAVAMNATADFCALRNTDQETIGKITLCIKEISEYILTHGFEHGKDNLIELRVAWSEDGWHMRFKDNCEHFDPVRFVRLAAKNHLRKNRSVARSGEMNHSMGKGIRSRSIGRHIPSKHEDRRAQMRHANGKALEVKKTGIELAFEQARKADFVNTLGLNILLIDI